MKAKELVEVTNLYEQQYYDDIFCNELLEELNKVNENDEAYIRYVGCTFAATATAKQVQNSSMSGCSALVSPV